MKYLSELIRIITKKQLQKNELLENEHLEQKDNLFSKFYFNLKKGKLKSDQDAALLLYGSKANNEKYRKLKSRFHKKLINNILLLDINSFKLPPSYLTEIQIKRDLGLASLFKAIGAFENARRLAKRALNAAEKYNYHESILTASILLTDLYNKKQSFKESEALQTKYKQALSAIQLEFQLLEENRTLCQLLRYQYPIIDIDLKSLNSLKTSENPINLSPNGFRLFFLNTMLKHSLKGEFETVSEIFEHNFPIDAWDKHTKDDLFRFVFLYFVGKCKSESPSFMQDLLNKYLNEERFENNKLETLGLSLITHHLEQKQIEDAIKIFNNLIQFLEKSKSKSLSSKVEIYYYFIQYFRVKNNILIPINRGSKFNQIDSLEDLRNIRIRHKELNRNQQIQINLLELISTNNRFNLIDKLDQIRSLNHSETQKLSKRASHLIKVLNHWERQDFIKIPVSVRKEFKILCESNFLNSQNLDTFEPVNYGMLLQLVFESQTVNIPSFT